jgi:hypothetical protein
MTALAHTLFVTDHPPLASRESLSQVVKDYEDRIQMVSFAVEDVAGW